MTKIGLLGDTHSNIRTIMYALDVFKEHGVRTVLQIGDFGFWPGTPGRTFLHMVESILSRNDQTLLVTPGNHEDYAQINALTPDAEGWLKAKSRIWVAPRGKRWEWEGVSFVSLGGAPSVDRAWRVREQRRTSHPLWWKEEEITTEDMQRTIEGGYADVMIAHDAPLGVPQIEKRIEGNPNGFAEEDLAYALTGREKMYQVVDAVRPKLFFHGHYHFRVDDTLSFQAGDDVRVIGLNADGDYGTLATLELDTLKFSILD